MDNAGYIFAAYALVWAVLFVYVFYIHRKHGKLQRELDSLKEDMDKTENA